MRGWAVAVGATASLLVATSPARAGVYADDLSKCLVKSTSAGDQKALVFWIFTFSMAFASRRVEAAVGLGKR